MRIDQRNAGASVTVNQTANIYVMDRWRCRGESSDGVFTCQQVSEAPSGQGFKNSAKITVTTADASIGVSQVYGFQQLIEGFNVADLDWGTTSAKAITLSFWVRSSLTGTFGGALSNGDLNRSYPFTYTISSADTWEQKLLTIVGDTTGTWLTTNGLGIRLNFSLGSGSNLLGTAGAWNGNNNVGATGETAVIGTLNATWQVTGAQLEAGTVATPFERRQFGQELALCQRYLPAWAFPAASTKISWTFPNSTTTNGSLILYNPVQTRVAVSGLIVSAASNFSVSDDDSSTALSSLAISNSSPLITCTSWSTATARTAFRPHSAFNNTAGAFIYGTGCEL
jgi:hypothetical protein